MKRRNPSFGYQRIADQIFLVFGIEIDKNVVRRVLAKYYRPRTITIGNVFTKGSEASYPIRGWRTQL